LKDSFQGKNKFPSGKANSGDFLNNIYLTLIPGELLGTRDYP